MRSVEGGELARRSLASAKLPTWAEGLHPWLLAQGAVTRALRESHSSQWVLDNAVSPVRSQICGPIAEMCLVRLDWRSRTLSAVEMPPGDKLRPSRSPMSPTGPARKTLHPVEAQEIWRGLPVAG